MSHCWSWWLSRWRSSAVGSIGIRMRRCRHEETDPDQPRSEKPRPVRWDTDPQRGPQGVPGGVRPERRPLRRQPFRGGLHHLGRFRVNAMLSDGRFEMDPALISQSGKSACVQASVGAPETPAWAPLQWRRIAVAAGLLRQGRQPLLDPHAGEQGAAALPVTLHLS